jgi:hypothetical protein
MAIPKIIRTLAGTARSKPPSPSEPLLPADVALSIVQLQNTVNELISRYNTHADAAHAGANKVAGGAGVAATNLFTTN